MKRINLLALLLVIISIGYAQKAPKSPRMKAEGKIDGVSVAVDYGAPSVRGRVVWGGMEKYGKVWRAGANENTTISFSADVKVGGKAIKAGKYGFFIIPNESGDWTIVLNSKNDGWGAYSYKENDDVLRVDISPQFVKDNQEQLLYAINDNSIQFAWAKARLSISVSK